MNALSTYTFDTLFPPWETTLLLTQCLDLGSLDFVTPGGMLLLLFGLVHTLRSLPSILLSVPIGGVRSYLARAGFFNALPAAVGVLPQLAPDERAMPILHGGNSASLLELTAIDSLDTLDNLLDKIIDTTEHQLGYTKKVALDLGVVVSELGRNALEHAGQCRAAGLMQLYGQGMQRRLELAIGDNGIGVAQSLICSGRYDLIGGDREAIETAIKPNVSCLSDITRGSGLDCVVTKTNQYGGRLDIRSGSAKASRSGGLGEALDPSGTATTWDASDPQPSRRFEVSMNATAPTPDIHEFRLARFGKRQWGQDQAEKPRLALEKALSDALPGAIVRVDCSGVEVFDVSFAAGLFVKTLGSLSSSFPDRCLVVSGLTDITRDNLNPALREAGLMAVEANAKTFRLLGKFSPSDEETLNLLHDKRRAFSVRELAEALSINVTAANERLTKLARMAILRRETARGGRTQQLFLAPAL